MEHRTHKAPRSARLAWWLHLLLALALVAQSLAQEAPATSTGPFADVPKDHWALGALERLAANGVLPGFADGTYQGRRIVSRYDLAVAVSRALDRARELQKEGSQVKDDDQRLLERLTVELRNELTLLGARVESLERRVEGQEQKADELDTRNSNIRIEGFYRVLETYVFRPVSFVGTLLLPEVDPFRNFRSLGLQPMEQQIFLRFFGTPFLDGGPATNVEVFAELLGVLSGPRGHDLNYRLADPIFSGDTIDDFATETVDDQRLSFNRAHFVNRAKRLNTRLFLNESATDLTDPSVLFTVDRFAPFSGAEASGSYKKLGYTGSVTKQRALTGSELSNFDDQLSLRQPSDFTFLGRLAGDERGVEDIRRVFQPGGLVDTDLYTTRLTYTPQKYRDNNLGRSQMVGGTFVEQVFSYDTLFDFNRVIAWDYQWGLHTKKRQWDSTLQWLLTEGRGDISDTGLKLDSTYQFGNFLTNLKAYSYGYDYQNRTGQYPFMDTDVFFNFKREITPGVDRNRDGNVDGYESTRGERAARLLMRYHFPREDVAALQDLTLSGLYEIKKWERDPANPIINDEIPASRFQGQALADLTTRLHMELTTELEKHLPLDRNGDGVLDRREGKVLNTARLDWRAAQKLNLLGEIQFIDDLDEKQSSGSLFHFRRHRLEASSQITPDFFIKGSTEKIFDSDLQLNGIPPKLVEGRNIDRQIAESSYAFTDWASLKVLAVFQGTKNRNFNFEDNYSELYIGEMDVNFSKTLKGRYIHGIQDTKLDNAGKVPILKNIFVINNYLELIYEPTEATELRLSYGNEYENPLDPLDNGPAKFFRTEQIVQLRAQTQF